MTKNPNDSLCEAAERERLQARYDADYNDALIEDEIKRRKHAARFGDSCDEVWIGGRISNGEVT